MFDPINIEKAIVAILSHPAMAEITALAGFAVSVAQNRKSKTLYLQSTAPFFKNFINVPNFGDVYQFWPDCFL